MGDGVMPLLPIVPEPYDYIKSQALINFIVEWTDLSVPPD
jgi:hypothetical protein